MRFNRKTREEMQDEILARMAEPDALRALRNQKERMESELRRKFEKQRAMSEADRLRGEIRRMGGTPCA